MTGGALTWPVDVSSAVVHAGWLIDGSGSPALRNCRITISHGIIRSVQPARPDDPAAPGGVDMSGCTVLPALLDSHVHLFMSGTDDPVYRRRQLAAEFDEIKSVIARHLRQHRAYGVIAVRDGGDRQAHALRYKETGPPSPPYLCVAGRAWHAEGRYGRLIGRSPGDGRSLATAVAADKSRIDHVKIVNSGLNSLVKFGHQTAPQFPPTELKAAVAAAAERGLPVMVHANGRLPVESAVLAGCRSIEHGFFMGRENLARMAERGTYWLPTVGTMQAFTRHLDETGRSGDVARRNLDHQLDQIRLAKQLGVRIVAGTDAGSIGVHHGSGLIEELRLLQTGGLTIEEAVCSAAGHAARLMDRPDLGRLAAKMPATFIVVAGNPSQLPDGLAAVGGIYCHGRFCPG